MKPNKTKRKFEFRCTFTFFTKLKTCLYETVVKWPGGKQAKGSGGLVLR